MGILTENIDFKIISMRLPSFRCIENDDGDDEGRGEGGATEGGNVDSNGGDGDDEGSTDHGTVGAGFGGNVDPNDPDADMSGGTAPPGYSLTDFFKAALNPFNYVNYGVQSFLGLLGLGTVAPFAGPLGAGLVDAAQKGGLSPGGPTQGIGGEADGTPAAERKPKPPEDEEKPKPPDSPKPPDEPLDTGETLEEKLRRESRERMGWFSSMRSNLTDPIIYKSGLY